MVAYENTLDVYDMQSNVTYTADFKRRISNVAFFSDGLIAIVGDKEHIEFHDISKNQLLSQFKAHEKRIKSIVLINRQQLPDLDDDDYLMFTVSSDSHLKVWSVSVSDDAIDGEPSLIASVDTTCRPTCLAVWTKPDDNEVVKKNKSKKMKLSVESEKPVRVGGDDDDDDDD